MVATVKDMKAPLSNLTGKAIGFNDLNSSKLCNVELESSISNTTGSEVIIEFIINFYFFF